MSWQIKVALQPVVNVVVVKPVTPDHPDKPAVAPRRAKAPPAVEARDPWDFSKSVFAKYKQETPDTLRKAFEADFRLTKLTKVIKDSAELQRVKELLNGHYEELKAIFKHYSAMDGDLYALGLLFMW